MKPELFLGLQTFDELRALCGSTHSAQYQRLLDQAHSYSCWLPPAEHPSKSITFIGMAAANLALAYRLSGHPVFLDTLNKWLDIATAYPHWGKERLPDHDLDAAWLLFGLGLTYAWVKEDLHAQKRADLETKLYLQGQRLYSYALETDGFWWSSAYWQNHNWICYAGLATAAYALQSKHPETRAWSQKALDNFTTVFDALPEDGSDYEGVVYWCYGIPWLLIYADLASQQEGIDFSNTPFLQNTFFYRLYMSGPNLVDTANFGDCHDRRSAHTRAIYYWFARHHRNEYAQWLAEYFEQSGEWERESREGLLLPGIKTQALLDLLWYDPSVPSRQIADLPLSRCFWDLGITSARTSWEPDATFLAFKSSVPLGLKAWATAQDLINNHNWDAISGGHLHPDENSFILVKGSDYLAVDEGYSSAKQTMQHNTILVDGKGQYLEGVYHIAKDLGARWGGQLKSVFSAGGVLYARGEAAAAYAPESGVRRFQRQIILWDEHLVLIYDDLAAEEPRMFEWLLQTDQIVNKDANSSHLFSSIAGETRLTLNFVAPADVCARNHVHEVVAVPSSAQPDDILKHSQHTLLVSPIKRQEKVQFFAVLNLSQKDSAPVQVEGIERSTGHTARITSQGQQILAGFAPIACYRETQNHIGTDGLWFVVQSQADGQVSKLAAGKTTRTFLAGQLWCAASSPVNFLYQKDGWTIESPSPTWVSVRVPQGAAVEQNGVTVSNTKESWIARQPVQCGLTRFRFK